MWICFELPRLNCDFSNVSSDCGFVSTVLDQVFLFRPLRANLNKFRPCMTKVWCLDRLEQMWIRFNSSQTNFDVSAFSSKSGAVSTALEQFWFFDCLVQLWTSFIRARSKFNVSIGSGKCGFVLTVLNQILMFRQSRTNVELFRLRSSNFGFSIVSSKCGLIWSALD